MSEYISVHVAADMLGLTPQRITQMIRAGVFTSAFKPGASKDGNGKNNCHWRVRRSEISAHKFNGHRPLSE